MKRKRKKGKTPDEIKEIGERLEGHLVNLSNGRRLSGGVRWPVEGLGWQHDALSIPVEERWRLQTR